MKLKFSLDPPQWKIIAGAAAIFLSDLGEALAQAPSETMTRVQVARIVIHAAALAFIFLSTGGEAKTPGAGQ